MKNTNSPQTVHLISLGCAKNTVDSEYILADLLKSGYQQTEDGAKADLLVINTCGFIEAAKKESIDEILTLGKEKRPGQQLMVTGCLSQRYQKELMQELPEVDHFFGVYEPGEIAASLQQKTNAQPAAKQFTGKRKSVTPGFGHHAFLKIAEGCNRRCGFCAIPAIRGPQRSGEIGGLVQEAQELQDRGAKEISLIAQDLTSYGLDLGVKGALSRLLRELLKETDISWFRLMYAYPAHIDKELLELMASEKRICNYLDLPIQHASTPMLKNMRRGYNQETLRTLIRNIRGTVPDIALRTTVLVGHPGETDSDFLQLLEFIEELRFERLGGFTYSPEEGTHAMEKLGKAPVPEDVARERLDEIMNTQQGISLDHNKKMVGNRLNVLVDSAVQGQGDFSWMGRTEYDAPEIDNGVLIRGDGVKPGQFYSIHIDGAWEFDLEGTLA